MADRGDSDRRGRRDDGPEADELLDRDGIGYGERAAGPRSRVPAPGKRSLTEQLLAGGSNAAESEPDWGALDEPTGEVSRGFYASARYQQAETAEEADPFEQATRGNRTEVPYRASMEALFGQSFGDVESYAGRSDGLQKLGAQAAARGNRVAFAESAPDAPTVAHELAHVVQQRQAKSSAIAAKGRPADRGDAAEVEADRVEARVARRGFAGPPIQITAQPTASLHLKGPHHGPLTDDSEFSSPVLQAQIVQQREVQADSKSPAEQSTAAGEGLKSARWELAERGETEEPPSVDLSDPRTISLGHIHLTTDPTVVRYWLEQQMGAHGLNAGELLQRSLDQHIETLKAQIANTEKLRNDSGLPEGGLPPGGLGHSDEQLETKRLQIKVVPEIKAVLAGQIQAVSADNLGFRARFEAEAMRLTRDLLGESEKVIHGQLAILGATHIPGTPGLVVKIHHPEELKRLESAAAELAERAKQIREFKAFKKKLVAREEVKAAAASSEMAAGIFKHVVDKPPPSPPPKLVEAGYNPSAPLTNEALSAQLDEIIQAREIDYAVLRADKEGQFPLLAAYPNNPEDLAKVTTDSDQFMRAIMDTGEKLGDILEVRRELGGEIPIWKLDQVMEMTRAKFQVLPGSMRDRVIKEEETNAKSGDLLGKALAVIALGLGILLAIPTGGTSAVAGTAIAAVEVAALTLDLYLFYETAQQYQRDSAIGNTSFDKAKALSHEEPSLFWLAFELIALGVQVSAVKETVGRALDLRRAVKNGHLPRAMVIRDELNALGGTKGSKGGKGVGDRVYADAVGSTDEVAGAGNASNKSGVPAKTETAAPQGSRKTDAEKVSLEGHKTKSRTETTETKAPAGDALKIENFTAPSTGKVIEAAASGNAIVPLNKVDIYARGRVADVSEELRELQRLKQTSRKQFDSDPSNAKRLDRLKAQRHNYDRSADMKRHLEAIGLPDTPPNNQVVTEHLLEVGNSVNASNRVWVPSVLKGPKGSLKVESTWKILDDQRAYLTTLKFMPIKPKAQSSPK